MSRFKVGDLVKVTGGPASGGFGKVKGKIVELTTINGRNVAMVLATEGSRPWAFYVEHLELVK